MFYARPARSSSRSLSHMVVQHDIFCVLEHLLLFLKYILNDASINITNEFLFISFLKCSLQEKVDTFDKTHFVISDSTTTARMRRSTKSFWR